MYRLIIPSLAAAVLASAPTLAQPVPPQLLPGVPPGHQKTMATIAAAQAAAARPGDDAMSCEAIETELKASMNDPAMKAYQAASVGAAVGASASAADSVSSAHNAASLAASFAGGGLGVPAMPGAVAGVVPNAAQQAHMIATMQAQMDALAPVMPLLARQQRLTQLAVVKQCAWLTGASAFGAGALDDAE